MTRSTVCFFASAAGGLPAWIIDVNTLSGSMQAAWLILVLGGAAIGGYFWAMDRK